MAIKTVRTEGENFQRRHFRKSADGFYDINGHLKDKKIDRIFKIPQNFM